jgi:hypothetical protein
MAPDQPISLAVYGGSILLIFSFHNRQKSISFVISTCVLYGRSLLRRMVRNFESANCFGENFL